MVLVRGSASLCHKDPSLIDLGIVFTQWRDRYTLMAALSKNLGVYFNKHNLQLIG